MKKSLRLNLIFFMSMFLLVDQSYSQNNVTVYPFNQEFATGCVGDNGINYSGTMEDITYTTSAGYAGNSGFVTFDLTKIPEGAQIVSAELIIYPLGSYTQVGSQGFAHATSLPVIPMYGAKVNKKEINKGEIWADYLDWSATIIAPISSPINAAGITAMNKRIGSSISFGIDPPKTTPNSRGIAGYNASGSGLGQKPELKITYNAGAKTKPLADFSPSTRDTFVTTDVSFFDNSGGYPSSWYWDFGDSTFSTEKNPKHAYADTGFYSVKLVVGNAQGKDSIVKTNIVHIQPSPGPAWADFQAGFRNVNANDDVYFNNLSTGVVNSWNWFFGDGDSSSDENPIHAYLTDGIYSVSLFINGPFGGDTIEKVNYINVGGDIQIPQANFSYEQQSGLIFKFSDQSKKFPESWSWDFGDGNISAKQNPMHTFEQEGNYKVCMIAENSAGTDSVCKSLSIKVLGIRDEFFGKDEIKVYPNPMNDFIYVDNTSGKLENLDIYNSLGVLVFETNKIEKNIERLSLEILPKGMYQMIIKSHNYFQSQKIIKF